MKTVYLHIGYFKTGTTALQHFMWHNREALGKRGFLYSQAGCMEEQGHLQLVSSIFKSHGLNIPVWLDKVPKPRAVWRAFHSEVEESGCEEVIVSNEHLCSFCQSPAAEPLIDELAGHLEGYKVKVIAYLRRVDGYLLSWHNQIMKMGNCTTPLPHYAKTLLEGRNHHLFHGRILDLFAERFGRDNVDVRLYDRKWLKGGDVVEDFLEGFGLNKEDFDPVEAEKNISIAPDSLGLRLLSNIGANATEAGRGFHGNINAMLNHLVAADSMGEGERLDVGALLDELWPHFTEIAERYNLDYLSLYDDRLALQSRFDLATGAACAEDERRFLVSAMGMLLKENEQSKLVLAYLRTRHDHLVAEMKRQTRTMNELVKLLTQVMAAK